MASWGESKTCWERGWDHPKRALPNRQVQCWRWLAVRNRLAKKGNFHWPHSCPQGR